MNIKFNNINDTIMDFKQYIRYNLSDKQNIIQIMNEPIFLRFKDKTHMNNSLETYYVNITYHLPNMIDENELYVVTSINDDYGVTIYNTWSYNNILKNILSIKHYIHLIECILDKNKSNKFSLKEKELIYNNIKVLFSQIVLIDTQDTLHFRFGSFIFDYEFIDSFGLKMKMIDIIRAGKGKINILKSLLL